MSPAIKFCAAAIVVSCLTATSPAEEARPVSFVNDVVPILTKAGCNMGACHAKAGGGQNGFQLSLLGFEPDEDYDALFKEGRGRRLFLADPEQSLILTKGSGGVPHGGGVRLVKSSEEYGTLKRWVAEGAPRVLKADQEFVGIEVQPASGIVQPGATQQLAVIASYADGTKRDVTTRSLFESNLEGMAEVTDEGLVTVGDIPGRVAIMVRYQGKISVFTAAIPLGAEIKEMPPERNEIDQLVFANLRTLGIPASEVCDDATFLRRVTLDIAGRLPTGEETIAFLENTAPEKRDQVIERLLQSPGYADYFANKWTTLLKNRRDDAADITSNFAFHAWIRDSLLANVSYDQLVRELLGATGTIISNPPVAWYKRVKDPKEQLEDVAQLFLGVRLQCAQCHHHPFERWSQDDYYSLSAFFSRVGRKPTATRGEDLIFHQRGVAEAKNVKSGQMLRPAALGDDIGEIPADEDPRLRLVDWMSKPENPFFAKAVVNRYWKHFFGRGLIEPEDDIRDSNPPTNPELLAALEKHFIESGFDLKELVRFITTSNAYQLSSRPNDANLADNQNFSRFYPRRMQAEVLLDSIDDLTGTRTTFANLPSGTRAIALPDNSYNKASEFLRVFGRPDNSSVCECERVQTSSLAQSLHLINSSEVKNKLAAGSGRAATLAKSEAPLEQRVDEIYLMAFARYPNPSEQLAAVTYLQEPVEKSDGTTLPEDQALKQNLQDLIWALANTKEFLFIH
ncbi:MAG: DUF1553 domain-containing protein [Planctomycetaceae bacterium]|nr:DUF1553 domain-containing protein [Planctomycetaceae bacterium]